MIFGRKFGQSGGCQSRRETETGKIQLARPWLEFCLKITYLSSMRGPTQKERHVKHG